MVLLWYSKKARRAPETTTETLSPVRRTLLSDVVAFINFYRKAAAWFPGNKAGV